MSELSTKELAELVTKLSSRLEQAEAEIAELRKRSDASIPEDIVVAISAAVSAFLGNKEKLRPFATHVTARGQLRGANLSSSVCWV